MKIAEVYSHQNGREHIVVHRPEAWSEIEEAVAGVPVSASPPAINASLELTFSKCGWHPQKTRFWVCANADVLRSIHGQPLPAQKQRIEAAGCVPLLSWYGTDFVKDGVAVEVQLSENACVAYDIFVKHVGLFLDGVITVGVEIVPMRELAKEMPDGVPYYERALHDLTHQEPGVPAVPIVMLGIAP